MNLNRRHCLGAAVGTAAAMSASMVTGESKTDQLARPSGDLIENLGTARMFANRSALMDWVSQIGNVQVGTVATAGCCIYEFDGVETAISDMPGWKPHGHITPDHFATNATPGTTDMSAALQAAVTYLVSLGSGSFAGAGGGTIRLQNKQYYVGSKVIIPNDGDYIGIIGDDGATIYTDVSDVCLQINEDRLFTGGDTASTLSVYGIRIENIRFIHSNASATSSVAIRTGRCPQLRISNCLFLNFWISIDGHRMTETLIEGNRFSAVNRSAPVEAFIRMLGVFDSTNSHTPGGGVHIYENEFTGNPKNKKIVDHGILINSVDGIYIDQCHLVHYNYGLTTKPLNSPQSNKITDVRVAQCYFDGPAKGGRNISIEGSVSYGGTNGNGLYQDIEFSDCLFRGDLKAKYGAVIGVTDGGGFKEKRGGIENIKFVSCSFRQHEVAAIQANGAEDSKLEVVGLKISDSSFRAGNGSGSAVSYLNIEIRSAIVTGNSFGKETSAPNRCVSVKLSDAETDHAAIILTSNDFSTSTYTVEPFLVETKKGAFVTVSDNLTARPAQTRQGTFTAGTQGNIGSIIWDFTIGANATAANLNVSVIGVEEKGGSGHRVMTKYWAFLHKTQGTLSIESKNKELEDSSFSTNTTPVAVALMTGKAWSAGMSVLVGDVVQNSDGNVYLIVASDGSTGRREPVQMSGSFSDAGVQYVYMGKENSNKVVVFVTGESDVNMDWAASVDFVAVP